MRRLGCIVGLAIALAGAAVLLIGASRLGETTIEAETPFLIPAGSSLTSVAENLEEAGHISSADGFLLFARVFGSSEPIQAGEFSLSPGMSQGELLEMFQSGDVIRRFVTIPEGMPSVLVWERLMAEELLTGEIEVPPEGSILPDTYAFERGQPRSELVKQMQAAMDLYLAEAWAERSDDIAVTTIREALILASIVEKETARADERQRIAGVFARRLAKGMRLQTDPTVIYGIGPEFNGNLTRRDLRTDTAYNTYTRHGLPPTPIAMPGRAAIQAALNPADGTELYFVATGLGDGSHRFSTTKDEHDSAVREYLDRLRKNRR